MFPKVFEEYYHHAQVYGNVEAIPTPAFFYGLRLGEEILIEWTNRLRVFERRDATGNLHFKLGVNELQSTVIGLTSGTVWHSVGAENFSLNGDDSSAEAPGVFTHVNTINFVGTGGAPTLKILIREQFTINANEVLTVERSEVTVFCQ